MGVPWLEELLAATDRALERLGGLDADPRLLADLEALRWRLGTQLHDTATGVRAEEERRGRAASKP
jgi:hypothetical protein